jgi:hypothetical protein
MASREKKFRLSEIDLARAAVAPEYQRKALIQSATGGRGYPFYKGFRISLPTVLRVPIGLLLPAPTVSKKQILTAIARACNDAPGEVAGNKSTGEGFVDYVAKHDITAAEFNFDPVALGPAGRRQFWAPFILKIDGKKYIPFFDPRRNDGLTTDALRFVFSINHTYIRLANPTEWGDVGFVVFQFDDSRKGPRKVIPRFDAGMTFWNETEIGAMIDNVYRALEEIRRAA